MENEDMNRNFMDYTWGTYSFQSIVRENNENYER